MSGPKAFPDAAAVVPPGKELEAFIKEQLQEMRTWDRAHSPHRKGREEEKEGKSGRAERGWGLGLSGEGWSLV